MYPIKLAKKAVKNYIQDKQIVDLSEEEVPDNFLNEKAGVFVTLKRNGELRGCVGTPKPSQNNIAEEIISSAVSACKDPRLPAINKEEIQDLQFEVYILEEPEHFCDIEPQEEPEEKIKELNPKKEGILVKTDTKSALLLPDLEGLTTPMEQLNAALKKAGINSQEKYKILKFEAQKYVDE